MTAVYTTAIRRFASGEVDWENTDIRVMLVSPDYEPDQHADRTKADLNRQEITSAGYVEGGARLVNRSIQREDGPLGRTKLLGGRVSWDGITAVFNRAVVWSPDLDQLIGYADLGRQQATDASVSLTFTDGVLEFEVLPPLG